ncbi:hypothetical protein [Caldalkalibacillus mannanilyticus]|uniref:hypothetical protein n=1 Tax=Caldalkalibacillus mannanilyticus TaxID=1418 RepID=UPI000469CA57|nr:hypothetical protein [Caldalkalibacillus mannanilyticus]
MKIYITVKSLVKKNKFLTNREVTLSKTPNTLRELLVEIITQQVQQFNSKELETPFINYLTEQEMERHRMTGKIGFQSTYNDQNADPSQAVRAAIQAFEDGIFKVFVEEVELEQLDRPLLLKDGDVVVFIRLTMLAGRMW